jgi:protein-tyrosine phosphatase
MYFLIRLCLVTQALSVATNAENKSKNGSDSIIPYDRNRVILTPDGARPHSTYINASFIEGYHNDESFIITQDPLEVP